MGPLLKPTSQGRDGGDTVRRELSWPDVEGIHMKRMSKHREVVHEDQLATPRASVLQDRDSTSIIVV